MTENTAAAKTDQPSTCKCGCGEPVARNFKQGHDQRLISKLAEDLVYGTIWGGRCLGLLAKADVKADIQFRIDKVTDRISKGISEPLAAKFANAATRAWELEKGKEARAEAKAARKAKADAKPAKAAKAPKAAKTEATPSVEAGDAPESRVGQPVVATASNADIDALEAEAAETPQAAGDYTLGQSVRVLIGKRKRNAKVHGMNQSGKVTAVALSTNGKETIKTDGFMVLASS